jgi:hypothetical protein
MAGTAFRPCSACTDAASVCRLKTGPKQPGRQRLTTGGDVGLASPVGPFDDQPRGTVPRPRALRSTGLRRPVRCLRVVRRLHLHLRPRRMRRMWCAPARGRARFLFLTGTPLSCCGQPGPGVGLRCGLRAVTWRSTRPGTAMEVAIGASSLTRLYHLRPGKQSSRFVPSQFFLKFDENYIK